MSLVCIRMSSFSYSYVLVCLPFVTRMYSYVFLLLLVRICMTSFCYSYFLACHTCHSCVLVSHPFVTRMYSCVILRYSYHSSVILPWTCWNSKCIFRTIGNTKSTLPWGKFFLLLTEIAFLQMSHSMAFYLKRYWSKIFHLTRDWSKDDVSVLQSLHLGDKKLFAKSILA